MMLVAQKHPLPASTSLVDRPPSLHNVTPSATHRTRSLDMLAEVAHRAATPSAVGSDAATPVSAHEKRLAEQLAHLASQHHASEYNRLKFGPRGSPYAYVPLSLHDPEQIKQLQEKQATHAQKKAWWPSNREHGHDAQEPPNGIKKAEGLATDANLVVSVSTNPAPAIVSSNSSDLQGELSAAIASSIPRSMVPPQTKTSDTHPINISLVVPFEHLPIISTLLKRATQPSPVMFDVPHHYHLDRVTAIPIPGMHTYPSTSRQPYPPSAFHNFAIPLAPSSSAPSPIRAPTAIQPRIHSHSQPPSIIWSQPNGGDVLQAALNEDRAVAERMDTDAPNDAHVKPMLPPLIVPSQRGPPSRHFMSESPPVLVSVKDAYPPFPAATEGLPAQTPAMLPPTPPLGVIRRARHRRASSAPPDMSALKLGSATGVGARARATRSTSAKDLRSAITTPAVIYRSPSWMAFSKAQQSSQARTHVMPRPMAPPHIVPSSVLPPSLARRTSGIDGLPTPRQSSHASLPPSSFTPLPTSSPLSDQPLSTPSGRAHPQASEDPTPSSFFASPLSVTSLTQNPAFLKRPGGSASPQPFSNGVVGPYVPGTTNGVNGTNGVKKKSRLGNLYLSSCPGKKVRLSGPVKGRGAICRDLRQDLNRVKELGVQCIICCLDDGELDYLGASWTEYSSVASELGLDVLRLPTPEGLAPLTPAALDEHLDRVIRAYTLRGVPVLAHCRGGVGRAGLVACCWLIRLGLVGWKMPELCSCSGAGSGDGGGSELGSRPESESDSSLAADALERSMEELTDLSSFGAFASLPAHSEATASPRVCRATVHLVERAIAVIRRRRSLKAVETYEQVKFLMEYVAHLDARARAGVGEEGEEAASFGGCDVE